MKFDISITAEATEDKVMFHASADCRELNWHIWESDEYVLDALKKLEKEIRNKVKEHQNG